MTRRALSSLLFAALVLGLIAGLSAIFQRTVLDHPGPLAFSYGEKNYELVEPMYLAILVITPLLLYGLRFSLADLPWQQQCASVCLRGLFFAALAVGLARPLTTTEQSKIATVFLVDVSDSVTDAAIEQARTTIHQAFDKKRAADEVRLISFADRPRLETLTAENGGDELVIPSVLDLRHTQPQLAAAKTADEENQEGDREASSARADDTKGTAVGTGGAGSDIQAALELGYGVFPPGYLKRAVLFSDGVETRGDLLSEANRARKFGVRLHSMPYTLPPPAEVAIRSLVLPDKVEIGEPFEIRAEIYSSRKNKARARLFQGEMLNGLDAVRDVELTPGLNELTFKSVVRFGGQVEYALKLDSLEADRFQQNNQVAVKLDVPGRPTVLYVEGQPQHSSYLTSALSSQQFDVDVRPPAAFPASLSEMSRYDMLILSDVPAEKVSLTSQDLIERYVRDVGGGFLFAGGERGFGLGGWSHTTLERLLPVRMDAERRKEMPSIAMALVIDRSGSMSGLPMEMAKAACSATVGTLRGDDLLEVIAFDASPIRYVKLQPARYRSRIQNEILQIDSGGGTALFPALDAAYQDLSVVQARKKHVILLTDGRADSQGIRDLVQAMVAEAITVTTVGLGDGADAELLRMIAENGGGRYHHVPDPNSLPRIFTRETEMISRQAAVEEWFPVQQTAPADFLAGIAIGSAPLLHGYVATQMKGPPAQQILASDQGEPILARWRVGLGHAVAWTSDVKNHWAVDWLRWSGFSKFFGQLVREHMRKKHEHEIDMKTTIVGDRVHAVVDALTPGERFDNGIVARLSVSNDSAEDRRELEMMQTAPGRYEADFRLDSHGSFSLRAEHLREQDDGSLKQIGVSYGHVAYPYPLEYASFEPDTERLTRAALATGGANRPEVELLFDPQGETIETHQELWSRAILAALVVFLFDLLVRRIRLFDRKFVARRKRPVQ
jgi:Mg-chelatase subunit ChlD